MSTVVKDIAQEMLGLAQEITREKSHEGALGLILKGYLERRIKECEEEISKFENKYGMTFEKYKEMLGEKITLSYEHEKDYMNWEASMIEYRFLKDEKKIIQKLQAPRMHILKEVKGSLEQIT